MKGNHRSDRQVKADCLVGKPQKRDTIIALLDLEPGSQEYAYLCRAAREAAMVITGKEAYLWGAIGVDFAPCSMNCNFCSLGEAWGIVNHEVSYSEEEIIQQIRQYVSCGVRFIVLRTTEFYSVDTLCQFIKDIRAQVAGEYELVLNIGEFDVQTANKIYESGVSGIYHALRLGEGRDTAFDPAQRNDTLNSVHRSPLKLIHLLEPVGMEHTSEEIADVFSQFFTARRRHLRCYGPDSGQRNTSGRKAAGFRPAFSSNRRRDQTMRRKKCARHLCSSPFKGSRHGRSQRRRCRTRRSAQRRQRCRRTVERLLIVRRRRIC